VVVPCRKQQWKSKKSQCPNNFKQFQHNAKHSPHTHTTNDTTTNDTPRTLFRIQFSLARKSGGQLQYFRRRLAHAFIVRLESG